MLTVCQVLCVRLWKWVGHWMCPQEVCVRQHDQVYGSEVLAKYWGFLGCCRCTYLPTCQWPSPGNSVVRTASEPHGVASGSLLSGPWRPSSLLSQLVTWLLTHIDLQGILTSYWWGTPVAVWWSQGKLFRLVLKNHRIIWETIYIENPIIEKNIFTKWIVI